MILSDKEKFEVIAKREDKDVLAEAVRRYTRYKAFVNGDSFLTLLKQITYYEKTNRQWESRKASAISTVAKAEELFSPVKKIFSAKGGSKHINLSDSKKKTFYNILSDVKDGLPLKKFFENVWMNKYIIDPNGIILNEISNDDLEPFYYSVASIYTRKVSGQRIEYIVFAPMKDEDGNEYYRYIDDAVDVYIKRKGDSYEVMENDFIVKGVQYLGAQKNVFGYVPGYVISDLKDQSYNMQTSIIAPIDELFKKYLQDNSIREISKAKHGFPTPVMVEQTCKVCDGKRYIDNKECPSCGGTGVESTTDVTDVFTIKRDALNNTVGNIDVNNVLAYVVPPIDSLDAMKQDLVDLAKEMERTLWGVQRVETADNETATGRFIDTQPVNDKLTSISTSLDVVMNKQVDIEGDFYFGVSYKGATIVNGKRFIIETPDVIFTKLTDAKNNGASTLALRELYYDWLYSEYENDQLELMRQIKLFQIEPWPFNTAQEVKEFELPRNEYNKKIYFQEWLNSVDSDYTLVTPKEKLLSDFESYVELKTTQNAKLQGNSGSEPQD